MFDKLVTILNTHYPDTRIWAGSSTATLSIAGGDLSIVRAGETWDIEVDFYQLWYTYRNDWPCAETLAYEVRELARDLEGRSLYDSGDDETIAELRRLADILSVGGL